MLPRCKSSYPTAVGFKLRSTKLCITIFDYVSNLIVILADLALCLIMLFTKGFVDWFKSKELADVVIHTSSTTEIGAKEKDKAATKHKDRPPPELETCDYYAHRIILSYHSNFFLDWFKKATSLALEASKCAAAALPDEPVGTSTDESKTKPDEPTGTTSSNKKKRKQRTPELANVAYHVEIHFSNEHQFKFFPTILQYLYGQPFDITEVRSI